MKIWRQFRGTGRQTAGGWSKKEIIWENEIFCFIQGLWTSVFNLPSTDITNNLIVLMFDCKCSAPDDYTTSDLNVHSDIT